MLAMYSKESDDTGPAFGQGDDQVTGVETVDTNAIEIEEAVEEGEEVVEEGQRIDESVETIMDASESLENSVAFIQSLRDRGERVTGPAIQMWASGVVTSMEARGIPASLFDADLVEFGDSFESDTFSDYSVEAEDKAEGIMTKLWNMIKAAFARMFQWVTRFVGWFRTSGKAVRKAAVALETATDKAISDKLVAGERKVRSAPFGDLVVGGKVDPKGSLSVLNNAIGLSMDTATSLAESVMKEVKSLNATPSLWSKIVGSFMKDLKTTVERFSNSRDIADLPGGRSISAVGDKGKRMNFFGSERFTFKLQVVKAKGGSKPTEWSAPLQLGEIKDLAKGLITLVDNSDKAFSDFEKQFANVKFNVNPKDGATAEEIKDARKLTQLLQSTMLAAQRIPSTVAPIVFPIAKRAYLYGKVSLNQYKKAK